jgi:hypothetical protein
MQQQPRRARRDALHMLLPARARTITAIAVMEAAGHQHQTSIGSV